MTVNELVKKLRDFKEQYGGNFEVVINSDGDTIDSDEPFTLVNDQVIINAF